MIKREHLELLLIFSVVFITTQLIDAYFPVKQRSDLRNIPQEVQTNQIAKKTFSCDLIDLSFDENSGVLTDVALHQYPVSKTESNFSQTLFTNKDGSKAQNLMSSIMTLDSKKQYTNEGVRSEDLVVTSINWGIPGKEVVIARESPGFALKETYSINGYVVKKQSVVKNKTHNPVSFFYLQQIMNRGSTAQPGTIPGTRMFHGASFHTPTIAYEKVPLSKFEKKSFRADADSGWMSFSERYFVTALKIPYEGRFYTKFVADLDMRIAGHVSKQQNLGPLEETHFETDIYSGPESQKLLEEFAPKLDMVIDYGVLWPLSKAALFFLTQIHSIVMDWGCSIILLTLLLQAAFFPLTKKMNKHSEKSRSLQPKLEAIKARCGDNQQLYQQEMIAFYKKENINPLTSLAFFFAIILRSSVLIAFYWALMESIDLRHASFLGVIQDLSSPDPYYVLPVLLSLTMFVQQKFTNAPVQEEFKAAYKVLPLIVGAFSITFPAGLSLYWITSNIIAVIPSFMTWYDYKTIQKA